MLCASAMLVHGFNRASEHCACTAKLSPQTLTVYRTTPLNVTGLRNKNSADAAGDISFIFQQYPKLQPPNCSIAPLPRECWNESPVAPMIGSFLIEALVDPTAFYEECNPRRVRDPPDPWFDTRDYECLGRRRRLAVPSCACNQTGGSSRSVSREPSWEPAYGMSGLWYSTPIEGECRAGAPIGTSGCTWRLVRTQKYLSTRCMLSHIDAAVKAWASQCFRRCSPPHERSCFVACYMAVLAGDAKQNISRLPASNYVKLWESAFERDDAPSGGCPPMTPLRCVGPQCE